MRVDPSERQRRRAEGDAAMKDPRVPTVTRAIAEAMDWNVRAYGKLACEEDAEFFAVEVILALRREEAKAA